MTAYVQSLKERVVQAEAERDYYKSLVDAFFSGDVPNGSTFDHMILAKYGRKRIGELSKQPALLTKPTD